MTVTIQTKAKAQLRDGYWWYEKQDPGAGDYFLRSMYGEIESLPGYPGIHRKIRGYHRLLTATFPFAIYYSIQNDAILVKAILDTRRSPAWIRKQLGG